MKYLYRSMHTAIKLEDLICPAGFLLHSPLTAMVPLIKFYFPSTVGLDTALQLNYCH